MIGRGEREGEGTKKLGEIMPSSGNDRRAGDRGCVLPNGSTAATTMTWRSGG